MTQVGTSSTWWRYTYDTLGRVATQRFTVSGADILTETVTYNNANQVQSIQKVTPENTRTHCYTYDANGNIATVTVGNKTIRYTYDTAGQLIREDDPNECFTTVWTYDNAGNILTEKVYMYTLGTPNDLLETNDYAYTSTQWGDLLTAYNGNMIYYDGITTSGGFKIGNPTTYYNGTHWTFTWEHGRQLATMTSGGTTWTNTYNSDGLRTSRTNGTTTYNYYYEGSQLTSVSDGDVDIWIFYDASRPVIIKYRDGGDEDTYHYELNLQGDVIAILDPDGNRVVEYTYDAWGNILSISGSEKDTLGQANPLRYRGYVYDPETQLYYLQSRYYDPKTHRFLNADAFASTGQGFVGNNMFAYCGNDPVMYSDPTGNAYQGIFSQINYSEHDHMYGGLRENFYCLPDVNEVTNADILNAVLSISDSSLQTTIAYFIPRAAVPVAIIAAIKSYDDCRNTGLGLWQSLGITILSTVFSIFPYDRYNITKTYSNDLIQGFLGNGAQDILINQGLANVPISEQMRNIQTYQTNKSAGILIGGGLRCMYTNYTGMRRDFFGIP